jgi:hypothetical protein
MARCQMFNQLFLAASNAQLLGYYRLITIKISYLRRAGVEKVLTTVALYAPPR